MSHIKIDNNKCKSCYLCVDVCPKKLIKKSETIGKTGEYIAQFCDKNNECIACAQCAMVCPDIAITEVIKS
ncbi:MAG: 4Fe-4S binding protein [Candidatus Gastranaerophilales bacterium]|nr:4Fe-4S binding protein [Candidatus Gastranaerophilales bacterium]